MAVQLLSKPRDDPESEVVGAGVLHGLPGESIHCMTIEDDEFSVQVQSSLKDDHELQCPVEDENVLSMNQAIGWFIRWPATDMRLLDAPVEEAPRAVGGVVDFSTAAPDSNATNAASHGRATTRAGAKKLKSPVKESAKSPPQNQKPKEDTRKLPKKVAFNNKPQVSSLTLFLMHK